MGKEYYERSLTISIKERIRVGDRFHVVIKRGRHSKTLGGEEAVGERLGPFVATKVSYDVVRAGNRMFSISDFTISKGV